MAQNSDLIVIGGGPGGYVAAIRGAQLGMKVTLIEREHLGGICLNWGCIPTKALLRSAEIWRHIQHAESFGLSAPGATFDLSKIVQRSRGVASQLSNGVRFLLKKNKVEVIEGEARLIAPGKVSVQKDGKSIADLTAPHIILATGARARVLPGLEPDGKLVWTYKEALVPDTLPKSLLVIGSGAIGIEFASFYRALGVDVTVVEVVDRILPVEDEEIATLAHKSFEKQGMKIIAGISVKKLERSANTVTVHIEKGGVPQTLTVDRVLVAVGITGNVENLGLENTKVQIDRGHIKVDPWCQTDEKGIYAIGDIANPPWLAHKASHEGVMCVEKIKGLPNLHPLDPTNIPGCTYSFPQIASVGMTEAKAKAVGKKIKVGRFPFVGNGKAVALGDTEGLIKTIYDADTGEMLGAHMIGPEVTEMIQGYVTARTLETSADELIASVYPHPTLSEAMHESTLDAYGHAVHI